jgi:hypothetical protein
VTGIPLSCPPEAMAHAPRGPRQSLTVTDRYCLGPGAAFVIASAFGGVGVLR